jgi:hypothetical protein
MESLEPELIDTIRAFARKGILPSQILREIVRLVSEDRADRQFLTRAVSTAFRFTEGEGYVVFGWLPDGTGGLSDRQLDYQLSKHIQAARPRWDTSQENPTVELVAAPDPIQG